MKDSKDDSTTHSPFMKALLDLERQRKEGKLPMSPDLPGSDSSASSGDDGWSAVIDPPLSEFELEMAQGLVRDFPRLTKEEAAIAVRNT